jgi:hypothetical protein
MQLRAQRVEGRRQGRGARGHLIEPEPADEAQLGGGVWAGGAGRRDDELLDVQRQQVPVVVMKHVSRSLECWVLHQAASGTILLLLHRTNTADQADGPEIALVIR